MDEDLHFSKSIQTKALKVTSVFISAFPGYIVFGKTCDKVYRKGSFFYFSVFEVYKLYLSFFKILSFFTSDTLEDEDEKKGLILEHDNLSVEESYYWYGLELTNSKNVTNKYIKFAIERKSSTICQIHMTLNDLQNFVKALKSSVLISLCLNDIENELIILASANSPEQILKLKSESEAKDFVLKFLSEKTEKTENASVIVFIQLLQYYNDILVLLNKLNSLCSLEENIGEKILNLQ
jgi:hypothetical protein